MKQSPIDIPKFMLSSGSKPLSFSKYDQVSDSSVLKIKEMVILQVRTDVLSNSVLHYKINGVNVGNDGHRITDGTLKNNGHTAVSWVQYHGYNLTNMYIWQQLDVTITGDDIGGKIRILKLIREKKIAQIFKIMTKNQEFKFVLRQE